MAPMSPGGGGTTMTLPSTFSSRWSPILSRSDAEPSVEVPSSIRWSSGLQVLHGLTSGGSKLVKAEDVDHWRRSVKVKGRVWSLKGRGPPISSLSLAFQPWFKLSPYHSCKFRPLQKSSFLAGDCIWRMQLLPQVCCKINGSLRNSFVHPMVKVKILPMVKVCLSSMKKDLFRIKIISCLKCGSWMIRPVPVFEMEACLLLELSPRSCFKLKTNVFRSMFKFMLSDVLRFCF
ncbi:hypothetical protein GQ457_14G026560 [Hibiscus cannabinus]